MSADKVVRLQRVVMGAHCEGYETVQAALRVGFAKGQKVRLIFVDWRGDETGVSDEGIVVDSGHEPYADFPLHIRFKDGNEGNFDWIGGRQDPDLWVVVREDPFQDASDHNLPRFVSGTNPVFVRLTCT